MLRIGPAGNSQAFYDQGFKSTYQAPEFLAKIGLNAFEYSFGRGVNMTEATAQKIGEQMRLYDIAVSAHAPYYINLASLDTESVAKAIGYLAKASVALNLMGGSRVIFHPGVQAKDGRANSLARIKAALNVIVTYMKDNYSHEFILCPETMGKYSQIGDVEEILDFCTVDDCLIPCFDFGHINCLMQGGLRQAEDYIKIFERAIAVVGRQKIQNCHIHFSKIQYSGKGEIRHLDFSDTEFGPEFPPLALAINELGLTPTIICESRDNMSDDAIVMRDIHASLAKKN